MLTINARKISLFQYYDDMAFVRTWLAYQMICQSVTDLYHDGYDHASVSDCGCGMMNGSASDRPSSV